MDLGHIIPDNIASAPAAGLQEILRYFLVRTNFVPGVRHLLGWRGLKDISGDLDAWTARIEDYRGIFGLFFDNAVSQGEWIRGSLGLNYFPHPEEDLVEGLSIQAATLTQTPSYWESVRKFIADPDYCNGFNIGMINLALHASGKGIALGLGSITRQQVIATHGITVDAGGNSTVLVPPGGCDQDFPSYETALAFFKVLAASITFNLDAPPARLVFQRGAGMIRSYNAEGQVSTWVSEENEERRLLLEYGRTDRDDMRLPIGNDTFQAVAPPVIWQTGDAVPERFEGARWWSAHQIGSTKSMDKSALGIDERPQLIVLSGYLGAGKTSFLQHFIEYQNQNNRFVAVVQNEIGAVGLDGKLLDSDYAVTEIDEGCVCCTMVGNVKKALHQILGEFQPDYIVLETTGLANPFNLLDELAEVEDLVRFDSVTTVVDGLNIDRILNNSDIGQDQIKAADIVLLNKKDLLSASQLGQVEKAIRAINPDAPVLATTHGDINPTLLYSMDPVDLPAAKNRTGQIHLHHIHRHEAMETHKIVFPNPVSRSAVLAALEEIGGKVFRIKGVVDFLNEDASQLIQCVAGRCQLSDFQNPTMTERFLVFIGQNLDKDALAACFDMRIGNPR